MADFILKSTENLKFFFIIFFFKWIKDIDLFQTMDKGGKIVVVYEKYFLVLLLMFYLFQNGVKLWKFGKQAFFRDISKIIG